MTSEKEYRSFLKWFFHEYVEEKIKKVYGYTSDWDGRDEWSDRIKELAGVVKRLRKAQVFLDTARELGSEYLGLRGRVSKPETEADDKKEYAREMKRLEEYFIKDWMLYDTLNAVNRNLEFNNKVMVEEGLADDIQDNFDAIVEPASVDIFPKEDFQALSFAGLPDTKLDLESRLYRTKIKKKTFSVEMGGKISVRLNQTRVFIEKDMEIYEPDDGEEKKKPKKKPKKKWFKGLGTIGTGLIISLADLAVGLSIVKTAVPAEVSSYGMVVSLATGIGSILSGIGEIRGE